MTETIQTAMDRLMTISVEPQDNVAEDGLLYCGSCKTPKEAFFPNGKKLFGRDRHPAECRCRQATREKQTSVYKGYKRDKIEMRVDRVEVSDFPLYLNTVAGGLDRRDQTIGGFSFVVKIYAVPVVEIIG